MLADCVQLVKDDNVKAALVAFLFLLRISSLSGQTHLLLRIGKELADVLLTLSDELVQDFGTIDDLWLSRVEHLSYLPRHQSLSRPWWTEEEDTC